MDTKQIVTLAIVFVAGLVLGNLAGEVTGFATKETTVTVSPSIVTLKTGVSDIVSTDVTQIVKISVNAGEQIRKEIGVYIASSGQRLSGSSGTVNLDGCGSIYCPSGKTYTVDYTIPQKTGNYYVSAFNSKNKEAGRGYFTIQ